MIKIFKDKKNIAIASSLVLGLLGVGMSAVALTQRPPCPPPKPEMHFEERSENHCESKDNERPNCRHKHDGFEGERQRKCPQPKREHGGKFDCDREKQPEKPKADLEADRKPEQSKND